ncbi:MAG: GntR family transcriptional regulator [Gaiellaceae bacterium]
MFSALELGVDRDGAPIHAQITTQIAAAIRAGTLPPGARLPGERDLSVVLGVSRMTVRQALGALERDGLVRRSVGRSGGTFVLEPKVERRSASTVGLSAELRRQGLAAGAEVISAAVEPARPRTAAALGLEPDEPVALVVRLRLAGGTPLALERSSLPERLYPGIEELDLGGSLYDLMHDVYGRRPVRAVERLETVAARPPDARALGVRPGAPLLLVERVGYGADGTALEFARDRFRGDRTRIVVESTEVEG